MGTDETAARKNEVLDYLQKSSHEFHQVFGNAMMEYGKTEMKLIDDNLNFGYKLIQVTGIIAGFGFTGISGVRSIFLFVVGEFILILSVVYGANQIKKIYSSNLESVQKSSNESFTAFDKKSELYTNTIKTFLKTGTIDIDKFQSELESVDNNLVAVIKPETVNRTKDEGKFLNDLIIILILGASLLLLSFVNFGFNYSL